MRYAAVGLARLMVFMGALGLFWSAALAATYTFSQSGYSGGGRIDGGFIADDFDGNGQISFFAGEVYDYHLSFSGDAIVSSFAHNMQDLSGLIYDVGSGKLGDGTGGDVEGIASNWGGGVGFDYASGIGPTGDIGGRVLDLATGAMSVSAEVVSVSLVPEPATGLLFGAWSLLTLTLLKRRRGYAAQNS